MDLTVGGNGRLDAGHGAARLSQPGQVADRAEVDAVLLTQTGNQLPTGAFGDELASVP